MDDSSPSRHSSDVRLTLHAEGAAYDVAQVGRGYLILREPVELPECDAVLSMVVDATERRRNLRLVDGVQPFERTVRTEQI